VQQLSWYVFQRTTRKVSENILADAIQELVDQCDDVFEAKTDVLTAYQMNFLRAVADGNHTGLSSANIIRDYHLGSSANVNIIKKSLLDKDLIVIEDKKNIFSRSNHGPLAAKRIGLSAQLLTTNYLLLPPHHKLPVHHPRFRLHVRDVRAGGEVADVNGNCTLTNKIFQNSRRLI
jgi:hypothetical protein